MAERRACVRPVDRKQCRPAPETRQGEAGPGLERADAQGGGSTRRLGVRLPSPQTRRYGAGGAQDPIAVARRKQSIPLGLKATRGCRPRREKRFVPQIARSDDTLRSRRGPAAIETKPE